MSGKELLQVHPTAIVSEWARIGTGVRIGAFCEIRMDCSVGDWTAFGSRCTLAGGTVVGERCVIRYGFVACDKPAFDSRDVDTVTIGNNVRIGANVTVMPGVTIGDGATIGACSQVRHDVPAGETWYGNPARRVK